MNTTRDAEGADHPDDLDRGASSAADAAEESKVTEAPVESAEADAAAPRSVDPDDPTDQPSATARDTSSDAGSTSIYVRRRRIPTLAFWVAVLIAAPMVIALVISPFLVFRDTSSVVTFVLVVGVFVGIPLAAVAAVVDAVRNRSGGPRRR
ncbi:hypothetical protein BH708_18285 [Brachybacterium sp. P6-10-X1]|uniref:hypothetical protein n=1 Tax=Brachybacterium sp. P6-10-X1 TaxID=1903186 RepID=UPI000971BCCC|nr:hypothetical protein [Brachybacterium sp. P6-10-X1]APX34332.1 hypothetical protein BH708_18285 [Brachybacterium sp. P6-10-X1]